jgi:MoCo/4Fe-4S cofactor protein with predicted Tat translocation signal
MSNNKIYWRGTEELEKDPSFVKSSEKEFSEELPIEQFLGNKELDSTNTSRRDFLKFMGFGITAATLAACETPVIKSLPYVVKPNEVMPGIANYYASTFFDGHDYASILVKTREGRPIHIEGNKNSTVTQGGVSSRVNSSILPLYDTKRLQSPLKDGAASTWAEIDSEIKAQLESVKMSGGNISILSSTIISPSSLAIVNEMNDWLSGDGGATMTHVTFDAVSSAGLIEANKRSFGKAVVPTYHFDEAKTVVSLGSDFLVNGINSIAFAKGYGKMRNPETGMSRHYQFETTMSTTGSNADVRGAIKPSEQGVVALMLHNEVAKLSGGSAIGSPALSNDDNNVASKISQAAKDLVNAKGKSIVISGSNDPNIQQILNATNEMLDNYGSTIEIDNPTHLRKGSEQSVSSLIENMNSGQVSALLIIESDPIYSLPASMGFEAAASKVKTKIAFSAKADSTTAVCNYICSTGHYLENWDDANAVGNEVTFAQPVINKIYDTRQWQDSFLTWMDSEHSYYDYLNKAWNSPSTIEEDPTVAFASKWNTYIHDGVGVMSAATIVEEGATSSSIVEEVPSEIDTTTSAPASSSLASAAAAIGSSGDGMEVDFYLKAAIGVGNDADNPWLQELPDPVTKVVWDHYATMNPSDMNEAGLNTMMGEQQKAGMIRVNLGENSMELPVVAMPGQKRGTIGVALGYGKANVTEEGVERTIGKNAFAVLPMSNGFIQYSADCTFDKLEMRYNIASTQSSHTMMGRKILNETTLGDFESNNKDHWNPEITVADAYGKQQALDKLDLWNDHAIDLGHRWGLSIDLNTCIGCGACVTACHSENNVPIVGKDEVNRMRTMSWIRIDRYYSSDADPELHGDINQDKDYAAMEVPSEYPEVGFMPVMCQHCNHAPCETVCPVAATTHSDEGFNQMTYNRCIGTRYCANNCPYKVRRFNWFNYIADRKFTNINPAQDDLARMVLNPDVVVRSRGVMEKCSLCVQRVQSGKLDAKKAGEPIKDGSIQTACSASCPTNAIIFGDINDKESKVRSDAKNDRAYHLLEEIGVKPNVWYQTKVRNSIETADQTA